MTLDTTSMAIYLDDQAVDLDGDDLASVLSAAGRRLAPAGRVVVEVQLDGQRLTDEQIHEQRDKAVQDAELRLGSAAPAEVAVEALDQVREQLAGVRTTQQEAADLLQRDDAPAAMQKVAQTVQAWLQTQQAVAGASALTGVPLDRLEVDGQPVATIMAELIAALRQLKQVLEARDTVALADALAYEWPPIVEQWDRLIESLIEQIEKSQDKSRLRHG